MKINEILHGDCMDLMPLIPELNRDVLAIVDPPYGKNSLDGSRTARKYKINRGDNWDCIRPEKKYFQELFRISKNQIIWGGNYFITDLHDSKCFIIWDKPSMSGMKTMSFGEFAWTSFEHPAKKITMESDKKNRFHPTQKPVALYRWLLQNYAKPGQLILDTHSGSGSLACACHLEKYDFIAIEKDIDYYNDSVDRLDELRAQGRLF